MGLLTRGREMGLGCDPCFHPSCPWFMSILRMMWGVGGWGGGGECCRELRIVEC